MNPRYPKDATPSSTPERVEHASREPRPLRKAGCLRQGDHGAKVRELQQTLNFLGYRDLYGRMLVVDGDFGVSTHAALRAFQYLHCRRTDGVVDHDVRTALKRAEDWAQLGPPRAQDCLRLGDRGPDVRLLQILLIARGYGSTSDGPFPVDGYFGVRTAVALQIFQRDRGRAPTGKADMATLLELQQASMAPHAANTPPHDL
ncbi:peptidoglycan-binding protein [Lysobacter sp.]|uniref:peptidoglycan-binding domain-containing protein n=1 Tax=Lysobacter sp. TaxID=72226 RepID=UPI002D6E82F1|nr:peptidoglycan-binding protein [Lysobacter sp.]HZX77298.1 peptidoglycan-binding protein [Lysobacter sp.]